MMNKRGKIKILIAGTFLILLVGMVFVLALENNTKTYEEETRTITINNEGIEVATIKLNTPLVYNVIRGKDRLVAEFTVNNFDDYSNVFNDMEFYNIKNNMNKFDREFNYKYKKNLSFEIVSDYETICIDGEELVNGSISRECHQELKGTHQEEKFEWVILDKKNDLKKGNITIGIFTDVLPNEKVEWIPTMFGVRIDEWAEWDSVDYFEYSGGQTSCSGMSNYGNYLRMTDNNLAKVFKVYKNGTYISNFSTAGVGASNIYGMTENGIYIWIEDNTDTDMYVFYENETYITNWDYGADAGGNQVGLTHNESTLFLGDHVNADISLFNMSINSSSDYWGSFNVGASGNDDVWGLGAVSELLYSADKDDSMGYKHYQNGTWIENRSLITAPRGATADGEFVWFCNHSGVYKFEGLGLDITLPNATINTPLDQNYSVTTIVFNVTALDETEMSSCWYTLNSGVTNYTLTNTTTAPDDYIHTNSSMASGSHTAVFYCNDTSNNINDSEQVTFTINTPPTTPVQLLPANDSGFAMLSTTTFSWENSTDADGDTITYDIEIYNESDMLASNLIHSNTSISEGAENTSINIKLSDYTTQDDDYYWRVRANDSNYASDWSDVWEFQYANWTIVFNLTDSGTGEQIDTTGPQYDFDISCDNGFTATDVENPYTATDAFAPGTWNCTFSNLLNHYDGEKIFTVDSNKIVEVSISYGDTLTQEEHDWLEWLYNCWNSGDCWNLLTNINDTTTDIWQRLTGTNTDVITQEDVISYELSSSSNISINYTINVPYKSEVAVNELLPIRMYFWFTDVNRTKCHSQDKASDTNRAENYYCLPLVAEVLGPNDGTVTFQVDLRPNLADGTYNFTRSIEIDPVGVWTQYGREDIGQIEITETGDASIDVSDENLINSPTESSDTTSDSSSSSGSDKQSSVTNVYNTYITEESDEEEKTDNEVIHLNKPGITGGIIGTGLFSNYMFVIILGIFAGLFITIVISRTILKIKKN